MTEHRPDVGLDCPPAIRRLLDDMVGALRQQLSSALVGVYLHGSLAMGCFSEVGSDIDLLVITRGHIEPVVLQRVGQVFLELSDRAPPKGFEVSVVDTDSVHPFVHPAPFLLHYSNWFRDEFSAGTVDLTQRRTDADLAAHFTMAKARGIRLYGAAIHETLPDVPRGAFLDSVARDALASVAQIENGPTTGRGPVPTYGVLNLCRVLAYLADATIRSKDEGGEWALAHLDRRWHGVVAAALQRYREPGVPSLLDLAALASFARWAGAVVADAPPD